MAGNSVEPGRTVTSKLVAILAAFANGRDYTLSEPAMQTNLAVSTGAPAAERPRPRLWSNGNPARLPLHATCWARCCSPSDRGR
jgi:hypothetical protein